MLEVLFGRFCRRRIRFFKVPLNGRVPCSPTLPFRYGVLEIFGAAMHPLQARSKEWREIQSQVKRSLAAFGSGFRV